MHEMPELPSHTFAPHLHVTQPVDQPWMLDFPGSHFQSSPMQQSHFPQFQQTRNAAQVGAQLQGYGQPATDYHGFGQVAEALDMTLKEKNRRAQKKCREKIKVYFILRALRLVVKSSFGRSLDYVSLCRLSSLKLRSGMHTCRNSCKS